MEKPSANSELTRKVSGPEPRLELLGEKTTSWVVFRTEDGYLEYHKFSSEMEAISYFDRGVFLGPQFSYLKSEDDESYYHS